MKITETTLSGVLIIQPCVHRDHRGFFMESYSAQMFKRIGVNYQFIQDNHSLSVDRYVLRGLHYQLHPKAQTKLVRVTAGAIFDVVVDIRRHSPTFGKWIGVELSAHNKKQILIPKGFAHAYCTLEKNTEVQYKVDEIYSPEFERGIIWNDPILQITWPTLNPILSEKDCNHPKFINAEIEE